MGPVVRDTARAYRLGRLSRVRHVVWPSAAPYVLTGLWLGAAVALMLAISAELVIGRRGLGREIAGWGGGAASWGRRAGLDRPAGVLRRRARQPGVLALNGYTEQRAQRPIAVARGERIRMYVLDAGPSIWSAFQPVRDAELTGLREGTDGRLRVGAFPASARVSSLGSSESSGPSSRASDVAPGDELRGQPGGEARGRRARPRALCTLPPPEGPFTVIELFSDPYLLVVSRESEPLASNGTVRLEDLRELPLLEHRTDRWNEALDAALRAAGLAPTLVLSCDDATLQAFVKAGVGAALMKRLMVDFEDPDTVVYELDGIPPRRIGLLHHADRPLSPMAARFLALAEAAPVSGDQSTAASA